VSCPICMDAIVARVTGETRTSCGHSFHFQCLVSWMSVGSRKRCPVCRAEPSEKERIVLEGPMDSVDEGEGADSDAVVAGSLLMLGQLAVADSLQRLRR
jgi:hypothetical protein